MNQKADLEPYISSELKAGTPAATIKQRLIDHGWTEDIVDEVIADITTPTPTPAPAAASSLSSHLSQSLQEDGVLRTSPEATVQTIAAEHYSLRQASRDALTALQNNAQAVVVMILIGFTLTAIMYGLFALIVVVSGLGIGFMSAIVSQTIGLVQLIITIVLFVIFAIAVAALVSAFSLSIIALAINDGAENKKSDIKQTLSTALKRSVHVYLASLMTTLIIVSPLLVVGVLGLITSLISAKLAIFTFLLVIVALPIMLVLALRLALVPIIALFEPAVPVRALYARAQVLMSGGGAWFLVKAVAVLVVINIIVSIFSPHGASAGKGLGMLTFLSAIASLFISLLFNAILIIFYRNRKIVKG